MWGVFRCYHSGQIAAVCRRQHSMDGAGFPSGSGEAGWAALPGLTASQGWGPLGLGSPAVGVPCTIPWGCKWVVGAKPGRGPGTLPWTGRATWVPTAPTTHGMCVVKMERTAGRKGGLRGQISAHGAKELCFNWEGKGGKTTQTFLSLQGCQSPPLSFFRGKYCTFGKGFE